MTTIDRNVRTHERGVGGGRSGAAVALCAPLAWTLHSLLRLKEEALVVPGIMIQRAIEVGGSIGTLNVASPVPEWHRARSRASGPSSSDARADSPRAAC